MTTTLAPRTTAHSLRLHFLMEKQQRLEIGERIRELRENSAETNRSIAEHVGVGERSVAAWLAGGGIAWENAKKVAELFGVDVDYIWRGEAGKPTPDVMGALSESPDRVLLEQIDAKLDLLLDHFDLAELEQIADETAPAPARVSGRTGEQHG